MLACKTVLGLWFITTCQDYNGVSWSLGVKKDLDLNPGQRTLHIIMGKLTTLDLMV